MMTRWILVMAAVTFVTACASAPGQPASSATSTAAAKKVASNNSNTDKNKLICVEGMTMGSHIPQRVCISKAQAEARKKSDQSTLQDLQQHAGQVQQGQGMGPP